MVAKRHDFSANEIKAGVFVLAACAAGFLLTMAAMSRPDVLESMWSAFFAPPPVHRYVVKFEEAGGLNPNADVRFGGAMAGKVVELSLDAEARRIVATLEVRADVPVNTATLAYINQTTLTAQPHVELTVGSAEAPLIEEAVANSGAGEGRTVEIFNNLPVLPVTDGGIKGILTDARKLIGVEEAAEKGETLVTLANVVSTVQDTLGDGRAFIRQTSDILDQRNGDLGRILEEDIDPIFTSAQETVDSLADSSGVLNSWLKENDDRLSDTVISARQIAADVEALTAELEAYDAKVKSILNSTDDITDEAKALLERNAPVMEDMLADLRDAVRFFVTFAEILAENPQALLRGQQEGGRTTDGQGTLGRRADQP
jgi:ABC-type transporter Mla subunit MlaD